jgi:hypothetical protein
MIAARLRRVAYAATAAAFTIASPTLALAQSEPTNAGDATPPDTSGTNPTVLSSTLIIRNEYLWLSQSRFLTTPELRYAQPFADRKMSLQLRAPVPGTDVTGPAQFGFGDMVAVWAWIPYLDRRQGIALTPKIAAPTIVSPDVV